MRPFTFFRQRARAPLLRRFLPRLEALDDRIVPALTFAYDAATLTLDILSDAAPDTITVSNDASGTILVNGSSTGHTLATDTQKVRIFGNGGDDRIDLSTLNTLALSGGAVLDGGSGNDTLTGSAGNDVLTGGPGGDFINGGGGTNDRLVEQADANFDLDNGSLRITSGLLIENDTLLGVEQVELTGGPGQIISLENSVKMVRYSGGQVADWHDPTFSTARGDSLVETGFERELEEFVAAVREGREPESSIASSYQTMRLYEAIGRSVRENRTVEIDWAE